MITKFKDNLSGTYGAIKDASIEVTRDYVTNAHGARLSEIDEVMITGEFFPEQIDYFAFKTEYRDVLPKIQKVIFNNPATIVFWEDGTKTIVKADEENFDKEKGLAMAIAKKALGNEGNYYNLFKKYIGEKSND